MAGRQSHPEPKTSYASLFRASLGLELTRLRGLGNCRSMYGSSRRNEPSPRAPQSSEWSAAKTFTRSRLTCLRPLIGKRLGEVQGLDA